jgi:hypothetical protein
MLLREEKDGSFHAECARKELASVVVVVRVVEGRILVLEVASTGLGEDVELSFHLLDVRCDIFRYLKVDRVVATTRDLKVVDQSLRRELKMLHHISIVTRVTLVYNHQDARLLGRLGLGFHQHQRKLVGDVVHGGGHLGRGKDGSSH